MLTKEQQLDIAKRYASGQSYKQIYFETGINGATAASYIRRKHPNLQKRNEWKRAEKIQRGMKKLTADLGCSEAKAQAIYAAMLDRFDNKRKAAEASGHVFTIAFDDLKFPLICPYLEIELDYFQQNCKSDNYPTFDRIDNTKGYVKGNVLIVSWRGNRLKSNACYQELHKLVTNLQKLKVE